MNLDARKTWIGTTRQLQSYAPYYGVEAKVRVSYEDADSNRQVVEICADGALLLAKALRANVALIRPKRRS